MSLSSEFFESIQSHVLDCALRDWILYYLSLLNREILQGNYSWTDFEFHIWIYDIMRPAYEFNSSDVIYSIQHETSSFSYHAESH